MVFEMRFFIIIGASTMSSYLYRILLIDSKFGFSHTDWQTTGTNQSVPNNTFGTNAV